MVTFDICHCNFVELQCPYHVVTNMSKTKHSKKEQIMKIMYEYDSKITKLKTHISTTQMECSVRNKRFVN